MAVVKVTPGMAAQAVADTDWTRVDAMTDARIAHAVATDPDAAPIRRAEEITAARIVALRKAARMTQAGFAAAYGIPLGTLRDWEQGKSLPDATARSYLRAISRHPRTVAALLAG